MGFLYFKKGRNSAGQQKLECLDWPNTQKPNNTTFHLHTQPIYDP